VWRRQPGQVAQDPVEVVVGHIEAGEVAGGHALAEPTDQRLPLQEGVGEDLPRLGHAPD